jgi:hypothetical protein
VTQITYPDTKAVIAQSYDSAGHLTKVESLWGTGADVVFYQASAFNEDDQPTAINYGNGVSTQAQFYTAPRRLKRSYASTATGTIQHITYTYDKVSNIKGGGLGGCRAVTKAIEYADRRLPARCPALRPGSTVNDRFRNGEPAAPKVTQEAYDRAVPARHLEELSVEIISGYIRERIIEDRIAAKTANRIREVLHRIFGYHATIIAPYAVSVSLGCETINCCQIKTCVTIGREDNPHGNRSIHVPRRFFAAHKNTLSAPPDHERQGESAVHAGDIGAVPRRSRNSACGRRRWVLAGLAVIGPVKLWGRFKAVGEIAGHIAARLEPSVLSDGSPRSIRQRDGTLIPWIVVENWTQRGTTQWAFESCLPMTTPSFVTA